MLVLSDTKKENNELESLNDYQYAGGLKNIIRNVGDFIGGKTEGQQGKRDLKQADIDLQNKALELAMYKEQNKSEGLSALQITGITVASIMAITIMIVVIKKTRAGKG